MGFHSDMRGADLHAPSTEIIEQHTGSTLNKLQVVSLSGMGAVYPNVIACDPITNSPFGIVQADILNNANGTVTCLGFMFNINTSSWAVNTILYSDISGNISTVVNGAPIAYVVKQDAALGVIYVTCLVASTSIDLNEWSLKGNTGTNPAIDFIGTTDNQPLKIRTNNNNIAQFDVNGRFGIGSDAPLSTVHIKPYSGYTNSGMRLDSFTMTTNTTADSNLYGITLNDGSVVKITLEVTGRQSDGIDRCSFTRSGLFYKEGGNVQLQGPVWQSDFTSKSNSIFNVSFSLGINTIMMKVKAASAIDTYWSGNIKIEILQNNI